MPWCQSDDDYCQHRFQITCSMLHLAAGFASVASQHPKTTCQTGKQNGTLSSEIGSERCDMDGDQTMADRFAGVRRPTHSKTIRVPGEGECHA
jgi:hypothetical protein